MLVRQSWWDRNIGYIYPGPFRTVEHALMSSAFAVAATLVFGQYDWPTVEAALGSADVDALARKAVVQGVIGSSRKRYESASVDVTLRDGRQLSAAIEAMPPGSVALTWDRAVEKFVRMTNHRLSEQNQSSIVAEVRDLDRRRDVRVLAGCLGDIRS